jgi:hypothetical protein
MHVFGCSITLIEGGATDEGYDVTETTFINDGDGVHKEWQRDASDCDGRLRDYGEVYCPMELLSRKEWECENQHTKQEEIYYLPTWTKLRHGYRDYAAEAMNY